MAIRTHQAAAADYGSVLAASFRSAYDAGQDWWSDDPARREVVPLLLAELTDTPADVLDVGTGRGRDAATLLAAGHRVTGLDLVEAAEWRELRDRYPDHARFVAGDVRGGGLPDVDAVLDNGCLQHQQPHDYRRLLRAFRQALRPGGVLVLSLFLTAEPIGRLHLADDGRHAREFTYDEAVTLLAQAGFTVTRTRRIERAAGQAYLALVARPRLT
jgi:SAM-dependent methyltransferase